MLTFVKSVCDWYMYFFTKKLNIFDFFDIFGSLTDTLVDMLADTFVDTFERISWTPSKEYQGHVRENIMDTYADTFEQISQTDKG